MVIVRRIKVYLENDYDSRIHHQLKNNQIIKIQTKNIKIAAINI